MQATTEPMRGEGLGAGLTDEPAREIYRQGEEAVVFALLQLAKQLAESPGGGSQNANTSLAEHALGHEAGLYQAAQFVSQEASRSPERSARSAARSDRSKAGGLPGDAESELRPIRNSSMRLANDSRHNTEQGS